jgi:hypothetical protein
MNAPLRYEYLEAEIYKTDTLGLTLGMKDGRAAVMAIKQNSVAAGTAILIGDKLEAVNGTMVLGWKLERIVGIIGALTGNSSRFFLYHTRRSRYIALGLIKLRLKRSCRTVNVALTAGNSAANGVHAQEQSILATVRPEEQQYLHNFIAMGFEPVPAILALRACNYDEERAMVFIVSQIEENDFQAQLDQTMVVSEENKESEADRKQQEAQRQGQTANLCELYSASTLLHHTHVMDLDSASAGRGATTPAYNMRWNRTRNPLKEIALLAPTTYGAAPVAGGGAGGAGGAGGGSSSGNAEEEEQEEEEEEEEAMLARALEMSRSMSRSTSSSKKRKRSAGVGANSADGTTTADIRSLLLRLLKLGRCGAHSRDSWNSINLIAPIPLSDCGHALQK